MTNWRAKLIAGAYGESTPKTPKRFAAVDSRTVSNFLRLVRVTGACDHQILLDDDVILAELDADDLRVLAETDRRDKQVWAGLLAYRLCIKRLGL